MSIAFDHILLARVCFTLTTAGWALGTLVVIGFWSVFFPALRRADRIVPEQAPSPT